MQIRYFGYNGFLLQEGATKIAVDPGASLYLLGLGPIIPRAEWPDVTHVVVTHGDPDHYWHADRVVEQAGAHLVCGSELVSVRDGRTYVVSPRARRFHHGTPLSGVHAMDPGDELDLDGVHVRAIAATHGDLVIRLLGGLIRKRVRKTPGEHFAAGCTGFVLTLAGVRIAVLGDTMLLPEWGRLEPDVLLIPIGGRRVQNTMDEDEALQAVELLAPRLVIPCHYDCGVLLSRRSNPADVERFAAGVQRLGCECVALQPGEVLERAASTLAPLSRTLLA